MLSRYTVKFGGESGQGINTLGKLLSKAVKDSGYPNFAYREYPSLIKGGVASYQIDISEDVISSSSRYTDFLVVLKKSALDKYLKDLSPKGTIIHDIEQLQLTPSQAEYVKKNDISIIYLNVKEIAESVKAPLIMANMVTLGFIWKVLKLDIKILKTIVKEHFSNKKNIDIEAEYRCLQAGYDLKEIEQIKNISPIKKGKKGWYKSISLTGNDSIALGALSAGCKAYYAYPMTPATSILEILGKLSKETGMVIKQAENEITAAQLCIGSMYMGARAFTATSGGGFDLMTETISFAGISETPLVIVLAQRNGPGTGVPTWTGAGDLNVAINSGHGEFPRCVISLSDVRDSYTLTQKAFNIAEKYQLPVIILTEKQISESLFNVIDLPKPIKIERSLKEGKNRYEITESGVSNRWLPNSKSSTYMQTSDEHTVQGWSTDESKDVSQMMEKRFKKIQTLKKELPGPKYFGSKDADIVFVGYGSVKNSVIDMMNLTDRKIGYLHYEYLYPIKTEKLINIYEDGARLIAIENNQSGELTELIRQNCGFEIPEKLLKFDGRPFFVEDILDYIKQ